MTWLIEILKIYLEDKVLCDQVFNIAKKSKI